MKRDLGIPKKKSNDEPHPACVLPKTLTTIKCKSMDICACRYEYLQSPDVHDGFWWWQYLMSNNIWWCP